VFIVSDQARWLTRQTIQAGGGVVDVIGKQKSYERNLEKRLGPPGTH
jgi:hypothetical protein